MTVCIECSSSVPAEMKYKLYCSFCNKKIDRYTEVNNAYIIIDLILIKERVFRHFLLNSRIDWLKITMLAIVHLCSIVSIRVANLQINPLTIHADQQMEIDFFYSNTVLQITSACIYIACLKVVFSSIATKMVVYSLLVSSFFNHIKIVFSLWKYEVVQYFIIIEILSCCGNVFALNCIDGDFTKVFSTVFTAKLISLAVPLSVVNAYCKA